MSFPGKKPSEFQSTAPRPAVFLDRDGTLMEEVEYCSRPEDVHVFPSAPNSLLRLQSAGFLTIIITNQSGIGRGYFTLEDYQKVNAQFLYEIGDRLITANYFCPDHPDYATDRRKPGIGMILEAQAAWNIDLSRSWMIGDKAADVECGKSAGLQTILVQTGYGSEQDCEPDHRTRDISSAVDWIVVP